MSNDSRRHMQERARQLGMPYGTARNVLNKQLMFNFVQRLGLDVCHQCGQRIENVDNLSVEHKKAWLHEPNARELFFDLNNIAFSHHKCNTAAARRTAFSEQAQLPVGGSGYRGVEVNADRRPGRAKYRVRFKNVTLAAGDDPRALALIYDKKAIEVYGPGAITNASLGLL